MRNTLILLIMLLILCTVFSPVGVSAEENGTTEDEPTVDDLKSGFDDVFSVVRICGIACAGLCIAICGIRYFTGNEEQAAQAKQVALYAVIALAVLLLLPAVLKLVKSLFSGSNYRISTWQPPES